MDHNTLPPPLWIQIIEWIARAVPASLPATTKECESFKAEAKSWAPMRASATKFRNMEGPLRHGREVFTTFVVETRRAKQNVADLVHTAEIIGLTLTEEGKAQAKKNFHNSAMERIWYAGQGERNAWMINASSGSDTSESSYGSLDA